MPPPGSSNDRWNVETLHIHLMSLISAAETLNSQRFGAQETQVGTAMVAAEKAVNAALASSDKAISVASVIAEKWRENANEWRGAMEDKDKTYATLVMFIALTKELDALTSRFNKGESTAQGAHQGTSRIGATILYILTAASLILSVFTFFRK